MKPESGNNVAAVSNRQAQETPRKKSISLGTLFIAILSFIIGILIFRHETQTTLGKVPIAGTDYRCWVVQSRKLSNKLGFGSSRIHVGIIDKNDITRISHDFPAWKSPGPAVWHAPADLVPVRKGDTTVLPVDLSFFDQPPVSHEVTIGIFSIH